MRRNNRIDLAMPALMQRFGLQLSTTAAILEQHSHDESWNPPDLPDAVIFAVDGRCGRHGPDLRRA
jgi:hypothetical protein